jgi:hypothetical protein
VKAAIAVAGTAHINRQYRARGSKETTRAIRQRTKSANRATGIGLAKSADVAIPAPMRPGLLRTSLRFLTWVCVVLLAVLSLMPLEEIEEVRTDLPGQVEHIIAYAGSAAIVVAGYGLSRRATPIIGAYWVYAATLEYLQHFSPGRNP